MKLLGNRMLVKRTSIEKQNKSGIIIPSMVQDTTFMGEVIKTGPGMLNEAGQRLPMSVKDGDKIIYNSTSGFHLKVDGNDFTVLNERDVLVVLEPEDIKE